MTDDEKYCRTAHYVDQVIPNLNNIELDGRTCNCQKLLFYKELCSCPGNPKYELKSKPNPSYGMGITG